MVVSAKENFRKWRAQIIKELDSFDLRFFLVPRSKALLRERSKIDIVKIKNSRKFERQLVRLCKKFEFDINSPTFRKGLVSKTKILNASKLYPSTCESLLAVHKDLQITFELSDEIYGRRKPKGALRAWPPKFAKLVLAGFEIQKNSRNGTKLMREFLSVRGEFTRIQRKKFPEYEPLRCVYAAAKADDSQWARQLKQDASRACLSEGKRHIVKSFRDNQEDFNALRMEVKREAYRIVNPKKAKS